MYMYRFVYLHIYIYILYTGINITIYLYHQISPISMGGIVDISWYLKLNPFRYHPRFLNGHRASFTNLNSML